MKTARRHVLLSAYACSPLWGSEPGVGWRWALELAQVHDVTVLTHAYFQHDIEAALAQAAPQPGLHFSYFQVPYVGGHPHRQLNSRLYYLLWQATVRQHVARLVQQRRPDLIHHLTWGSYRLPCFLGGLGAPLVLGPVGGGEGAPARLRRSWPWTEKLFYGLRALSIKLSRYDPLLHHGMRHAVCVLTKTRETRLALPMAARLKAFEAQETGIDGALQRPVHRPGFSPAGAATARPTLQLLYAGRLLGGKGITYLLAAMKLLQARAVPVHLRVAGDGRLLRWAHRTVAAQGLASHVTLLGKQPREQMNTLYDSSDVLAFPSWHDSSGNVVTEALARGLPVLCLDIGGPRYAVDARCAVIVATDGLDEAGLALALAKQIEALVLQPQRLAQLAQGACLRALELSWSHQVNRAYGLIGQRLAWTAQPTPQPAAAVTPP